MSSSAMSQPSAARRLAVARPMPDALPVTTAIRVILRLPPSRPWGLLWPDDRGEDHHAASTGPPAMSLPHATDGDRVDFVQYRPRHVLWSLHDRVGTITLNRPERKNP